MQQKTVNLQCCVSNPTPPSLFALVPEGLEDEAQAAAAAGLPVIRFQFDLGNDLPKITSRLASASLPCFGIHRGFMMSGERYTALFDYFQAHGIRMVVTPDQYESVHYYPNAYPELTGLSPRATWVPVDVPDAVCESLFLEAVRCVKSWGCKYVLLKDYVKSPKDQTERFLKVPVDCDLAELCCELVHVRGRRFYRGVVLKEHVDMRHYSVRGCPRSNEWRLFFAREKLLAVMPNSFQDDEVSHVPDEVLDWARASAASLNSPYLTIDVAESCSGAWFCLEAGDGGVSGPAPAQDLIEHWAALQLVFKG